MISLYPHLNSNPCCEMDNKRSMTYLIAAVKEKHKFNISFSIHDTIPPLKVVLVSGETIDEKPELILVFLHRRFHGLTKREEQTGNILHLRFFFASVTVHIMMLTYLKFKLVSQCSKQTTVTQESDSETLPVNSIRRYLTYNLKYIFCLFSLEKQSSITWMINRKKSFTLHSND